QDAHFQKLCPVSEKLRLRREPQELLLRFFAYSERYKQFKHDVERFLDRFVEEHRNKFERKRFEREFARTMEFVERHFPSGFAKGPGAKTTPRVRFEAIAVGVNLALRKEPELVPKDMSWLDSSQFVTLTTTHASNSAPRLTRRVEFVRDRLLEGVG